MDTSLKFLDGLNSAQRVAVEDVEGPQLIVAGAGSGKTRVLTFRLAFILTQGLAEPHELLALTFTNKAAKEMKERVEKVVGTEAKSIQMGTFHSVFARLLRIEAEKLNYTRNFTIYDDDDSLSLVNSIIKELKYDDKVIKPRNILSFISNCKNELLTPAMAKERVTDDFQLKAVTVYQIYQLRCVKANAMDFADLLMKPVELFLSHKEVLTKYQNRFKFIMVDEYQDTNHAQYIITKLLAANHRNITVVGDDAQSIYAFRGANIQNILNLKKDYPEMKIYKLEQNYRSTQNIVEAANSVIKFNRDQIPKNVFTENETGELINLIESDTENDEAKRVCDKIREVKQVQRFFNQDFAILYRTNAQSRAMEDALRRAGVKYKIFGGLSFYKRKEVKDLVAYLRISVNPADEQALVRIINYPTRGISDATVKTMIAYASASNLSLWQVIQNPEHSGINARAVTSVRAFVQKIHRFQVLASTQNAFNAVKTIADESGLLKELHTEGTAEGLARWENVQEMINAAKEYSESTNPEADMLEAYLAEISLFTDLDDADKETDYVTLMTIHASKGLEFKAVFLVGLEEGLFPGFNSMESRKDLEEERRLFYVAVTRAEKMLFISFAKSRLRYGQLQYNEPSRFLNEIDPRFITVSRSKGGGSAGSFKTTPNLPPQYVPVNNPLEKSVPFVADDPEKIAAGQKVFHQKFGPGTIINVEGMADQRKAHVEFEQGGLRVLLLKYAKLQIMP